MLTQYLIARGRQREIARLLIIGAAANLVVSVVLAFTVGTWGVALATLIVDVAVLAAAVPLSVGPAAGLRAGELARALLRPVLPALGSAVAGLRDRTQRRRRHQARAAAVRHRSGSLLASAAVWRLGLDGGGAPFVLAPARPRRPRRRRRSLAET